ncbi:methyl-accepting chemotaxis protein [Bradyrhizobium vignae]|uniref:Methyl-accepting chemotaxis protein n=1 Tax=Bradyrhizobium vignae TaxID=1549949 RepID=A0A2U3PUN0_9BRAD|nr:HAMP domain-containing methyl-accepting chemotaxis protein [Bradyrhizobium vignae]SPP92871.1 Methyl-accepting chemotaxis protein [Bradyrhizobium vignae]
MMKLMRNISIGTKLAISSLASTLLVGGLIFAGLKSNAVARATEDYAIAQSAVTQTAVEAKALVRTMEVAGRDVSLAKSTNDIQAAQRSVTERYQRTATIVDEILKLAQSQEVRDRAERMKTVARTFSDGVAEIASIRSEMMAIGGETGAGAPQPAASSQAAILEEKSAGIAKTRTIPAADELVSIAGEIADSSKNQALDAIVSSRQKMALVEVGSLVVGVVVALLLIGACIFSIVTIARPLQALAAGMRELADGNFSVVLPGLDRKDEIGGIAAAVEAFKLKADQVAREEAAAKTQQENLAAVQRKADMNRLADQFEAAVGEIVETVSSTSSQLEASAGILSHSTERAQQMTIVVAGASEEASTNVQSVASAAEELSSSVNEIGRQVQQSARMAGEAVGQARSTTERVSELSKAAARIGDVVELINTIAGQTNLLALNATIEAARAGDAGRGFAVVATEVKALAEQTAKATGEIGQQISGIQAATEESVVAIRDISGTIERLSEISSAIATAVEQQNAATQEISRNAQQAAQGTQQVSGNIGEVQQTATETGSASSQVLAASKSLSRDSNRLKEQVGRFLSTVRAA